MCAVSAIFDYGHRLRDDYWTRPRYEEFQRLVDQAKEFDKKTGQPDCEDPKKMKLMQKILDRLDAIEKKLV